MFISDFKSATMYIMTKVAVLRYTASQEIKSKYSVLHVATEMPEL